MTSSTMLRVLYNCFWLLVPILVFNVLLAHELPAAFQMDVFWKDIPRTISVPENLLRTLVMILPIFMRLGVSTQSQKLGLGLYLAGLLIYFASWIVLIAAPRCMWSASAIGFMAPAYTPVLWLAGIGLVGQQLLFSTALFKPWTYWALSAAFLAFHNLHCFTVYSRVVLK
ncbi:MAG: hypothetical protein WBQ94_24170 [Terracidiphilus sp.]